VLWALAAVTAAGAVLVYTPAGRAVAERFVTIDSLAKADYIIVLGGDHARGVEAANLYREGWAPKVIVTSDGDAADKLAEVVRAYGVPAKDILIDRAATRTNDHPATVAALSGIDRSRDRFIIVTSQFHTGRSKAVFTQQGYRNITFRCPRWETMGDLANPGPQGRLPTADLPPLVYEVAAWWMYKIKGWV
jgi:uncharacterized SAM-binding protein YcdF (DUF218 family)